MELPIIIVLEDDHDRTNWLRSAVIGVEILEYYSVKKFIEAVEHYKHSGRLKLVIFDHDLGCIPPDYDGSGLLSMTTDADGLTGHDAAKMVGKLQCPALVWSMNRDGRMRICYELADKCTRVYNAQFTSENRRRIAEIVLKHAFDK